MPLIQRIATALPAALALLAAAVAQAESPAARLPTVTVYKSPICGCCSKWIDHLEHAGFSVRAVDLRDLRPVKRSKGIPPALASCHTAEVDGYLVEGHVPAETVLRLLRERPAVKGLAVPGMPIGSPGMEQGDRVQPYAVVTFGGDGGPAVYERRP